MVKKVLVTGPEGSGTTATFVNLVVMCGLQRVKLDERAESPSIAHFSIPNGRPHDVVLDDKINPQSRAWISRDRIDDVTHIILVMRNSPDAIYSAYRRFFQDKPTPWMRTPRPELVGIERAIEFHEFALSRITSELSGLHVLEVHYELMVSDHRRYYANICEFIDAPMRGSIDFRPAQSRKFMQDREVAVEFLNRGWFQNIML